MFFSDQFIKSWEFEAFVKNFEKYRINSVVVLFKVEESLSWVDRILKTKDKNFACSSNVVVIVQEIFSPSGVVVEPLCVIFLLTLSYIGSSKKMCQSFSKSLWISCGSRFAITREG